MSASTATMENPVWKQVKEKCLRESIEERRKKRNCTELTSIETWPEYYNKKINKGNKDAEAEFPMTSKKVSIWKGDIRSLLIDTIVNSADEELMGGAGGVDKAIHAAAGPLLKDECKTCRGPSAGQSVITGGYNLPAKYVIHAVGPRDKNPDKLRDCYLTSLEHLIKVNQRSIAFPCISTGLHGYPTEEAAEVVLKTVQGWLKKNHEKVDRVIFCLFSDEDVYFYEEKLRKYFPIKGDPTDLWIQVTNQATATKKTKRLLKKRKEKFSNVFGWKRNCTELTSIETWPEYYNKKINKGNKHAEAEFPEISEKVSIWLGDITSLSIDTIVNAANGSLTERIRGVNKAIHDAAGPSLKDECDKLGYVSAGQSVITDGYKLPAKYVIHAVGHQPDNLDTLKDCYLSSLEDLIHKNQKTIAFPCISTALYDDPNDKAVEVVLKTVREWLEKNHEKVDRVIFCLYFEQDVRFYAEKLRKYFPMKGDRIVNLEYRTAAKTKDPIWKQMKEMYLKESIEERRKKRNCTELSSIETWPEYYNKKFKKGYKEAEAEPPKISKKVSIWKGDITSLLIDTIVNAVRWSLAVRGGGVDKAIHDAAGPFLKDECITIGYVSAGQSVITGGYNLSAKYVIHAVGHQPDNLDTLKDCYLSSLEHLINKNQKTIAFPCISTGLHGDPNDKAVEVVLKTVREWLEKNHEKVDRVIFCFFLEKDVDFYEQKLQKYFPMEEDCFDNGAAKIPSDTVENEPEGIDGLRIYQLAVELLMIICVMLIYPVFQTVKDYFF